MLLGRTGDGTTRVTYIAANRRAEARELEPTAHALTHSLSRLGPLKPAALTRTVCRPAVRSADWLVVFQVRQEFDSAGQGD